MKNSPFFKQAELLVQIIPFVSAETCFALKGGTAINFFVRNFPRLSVDIDLVYVPVEDRATSLRGIDEALRRIATRIRRSMPAARVTERELARERSVVKLTVRVPTVGEVKIEPNTVLRGLVHPTTERALAPRAVAVFGRSATTHTLSLAELYGGKLCAALDRQHPRDLFDVHETVAIGRRDHTVHGDRQNVALLNRNLWKILKSLGPSSDQVSIVIYEMQTHKALSGSSNYGAGGSSASLQSERHLQRSTT